MPARERMRIVGGAIVGLTALLLVGQLVLGRTLLGAAGVLVLFVPAIALLESGRRRPVRSWPDRVLGDAAFAVGIVILGSILVSLSPRGLDATSIAVVQLVVLGLAVVAWLRRPPATRRGAPRHARPGPAPGGVARPRLSRGGLVAGASGLLVMVGIACGAAGIAIATNAAQVHHAGGYLQFWSVPNAPGQGSALGIHNGLGGPVACDITVTRPGLAATGAQVGTIQAGATWQRTLRPAPSSETARWRIELSCRGGGQAIQRVLLIDPPR